MSSLLTNEQLKSIPELYASTILKDPICKFKIFLPNSNWTWYIIEIDKSDYNTCYGLVDGFEQELGYFSLSELESISDSYGLKAELDSSFKATRLSKIKGCIVKEFTFITTVKIAKNVAELYPNYKINCFTPKSLAKRFASGNSEKNSLKEFGFEYKTKELKNVGMGLLHN